MKKNNLNRRNFIKNTVLTSLGVGVTSGIAGVSKDDKQKHEKASIKEYRKFGKTGFNVSDISSGNPVNENVLTALLDSGVNLIDTGESYGNGNSEILIGKVLKNFKRENFFINSKLYAEKNFISKKDVIERTHKCLERLQTDYVDCMQIHSAETSAIIKDEAFHSAMEQLKKEGKVRHVGVSCHGNNWAYDIEENMEKILMAAIDDGRFDVILLAYNFVNADIAEKVLDACAQKNIATIIMKSNPVYIFSLMEYRVNKMREEGKKVDDYTQAFYDRYNIMQDSASRFFKEYGIRNEEDLLEAASKYVLSNSNAHTTIWDFRNLEDVLKMLKLSGQKLMEKDKIVLEGYNKYLGKYNCRIGCNECEAACPHQLPINRILRYNYYYSAKKQEKRAMSKFAKLKSKKPSEVCANCQGHCEINCRYGVSTRQLLNMAESNMAFIV